MTRALCLTLIALLSPAPTPAPTPTPIERGAEQIADLEAWRHDLFERTAGSVVFISTQDGLGSGFFISSDGWILTSAHVVGKQGKVDVVLRDGRRVSGEVKERAKNNIDFALVKVDLANTKPLELSTISNMKVGTWVGSVGHGAGGIWTFNTGMISNIYPAGSNKPVFQTDMPLNPGSSGGPILNRHGRVVGVVTAGIQAANNVNFGIKIDEALASLDLIGDHCQCFVFVAPKNIPVFLDGESIGSGPRMAVPAVPGSHEVFAVIDGVMKKYTITWPGNRGVDFTK